MHDIKETHGLEKMKKMVHLFLTDSLNCYLFHHYFLKSMGESKTTGLHLTSYIDLELNSFLDASWFSEQIYLDFENRQFPCPKNYDAYLKKYYGNYMEIPKDKTKHSDDPNVLIKFDEPYQKYLK